ncbi:MAG: hypothetical protein U0V87_12625 [Acidobacteriota bacterium]
MSLVKPGEIRARFPKQPPHEGSHAARALSLLQRDVMLGITHRNRPSFFAYFPSNTSYASSLGGNTGVGQSYDWLSSVRSIHGRFD